MIPSFAKQYIHAPRVLHFSAFIEKVTFGGKLLAFVERLFVFGVLG